jgi:hypothetical protein
LLTKLGLAQFTGRLFWRLADDWRLAFDIFDTAPPTHKAALPYCLPICPTGHYRINPNWAKTTGQ